MGRIESQIKYAKTEKGKATQTRYRQSAKGRAKRKVNSALFYQRHLARVKLRVRNKALRKRYGITVEEYNLMFERQNGLCACCGNPETLVNKFTGELQKLSVDHDHVTGLNRGLTCARCNRFVIPAVEHWAAIIPAAKKYLKILG